jgi:hypothetical protein
MKDKDQKQLELLYEQVSSEPFALLPQEKEYFDKIISQLADHIVYKKANLEKFADATHIYNQKKHLTNFDEALWTEPLPWFFDKSNTSPVEYAVNKTYKNWIIHNALSNVCVKKGRSPVDDTPSLKIEFMHPYDRDRVTDSVDITDKKGIEEGLRKLLVKSIEIWLDLAADLRNDEDEKIWYLWRKEKIKYQPMRDRIPELEGVF